MTPAIHRARKSVGFIWPQTLQKTLLTIWCWLLLDTLKINSHGHQSLWTNFSSYCENFSDFILPVIRKHFLSDPELTEDWKLSLDRVAAHVFSPLVDHTWGCDGRDAEEQEGESWANTWQTPLKVGSDKCNKFKLFVLSSNCASRAVNSEI